MCGIPKQSLLCFASGTRSLRGPILHHYSRLIEVLQLSWSHKLLKWLTFPFARNLKTDLSKLTKVLPLFPRWFFTSLASLFECICVNRSGSLIKVEIKFYHIHILRCGHVYIAVYKQPFILKGILYVLLIIHTHDTWIQPPKSSVTSEWIVMSLITQPCIFSSIPVPLPPSSLWS